MAYPVNREFRGMLKMSFGIRVFHSNTEICPIKPHFSPLCCQARHYAFLPTPMISPFSTIINIAIPATQRYNELGANPKLICVFVRAS